jgi:TM2 domain-containing membrane protein YozV
MNGSTCPYCRCSFEAEDEIITCAGCATRHHRDCLQENGGCTVFGCSQAPTEEPKINVTRQDMTSEMQPEAAASTPPPPPVGNAPPPPPRLDMAPIYMDLPQAVPHLTFAGYAPRLLEPPSPYAARKSRVVFVLLAVLLGAFGGHNFYAGYVKKAVIQLCITLLSCFAGCFISWIWAIVEACTVDRDDDGIAFV